MKYAIVTFYRVPNYGAMLQAYSLWKHLEEQGHQVVFVAAPRTVAGRQPLWRRYLSRSFRGFKGKLNYDLQYPITEFAAHYPQTKFCKTLEDVRRETADCDAYIVGSDQMWNPMWCSGRDLPLVMLDFAPEGKPRIAKSVSFGMKDWPQELQRTEAERLMHKFSSISVREESGVALAKAMSGLDDVRWEQDPTLLHDADFYRKLFPQTRKGLPGRYIFSYLLSWSDGEAEQKALDDTKKQLGIENVITDRMPVLKSMGLYRKVSLPEWLRRIANSSFVFTNSFHGTVFAIIFGKPFISLLIRGRMSGMNERIVSLLKSKGLENRMCYADEIDVVKGMF